MESKHRVEAERAGLFAFRALDFSEWGLLLSSSFFCAVVVLEPFTRDVVLAAITFARWHPRWERTPRQPHMLRQCYRSRVTSSLRTLIELEDIQSS